MTRLVIVAFFLSALALGCAQAFTEATRPRGDAFGTEQDHALLLHTLTVTTVPDCSGPNPTEECLANPSKVPRVVSYGHLFEGLPDCLALYVKNYSELSDDDKERVQSCDRTIQKQTAAQTLTVMRWIEYLFQDKPRGDAWEYMKSLLESTLDGESAKTKV